MALGFGFNKAKVLSQAEKFVQQGKLQNAIAEYDKVSKQDPKDLTVLNTIGDLYARLGRPDQATEYFRRVGDAYASDGFVVKAIAIYKKLTKLHPSATNQLIRLAELYTQQGLYNDARAQYMAVADQYLKANDRESATGILKKMLDLDPDNAAMQTKVADLYVKLGKNKEALDIYLASAQSLFQRGTLDAAEEAVANVLKIEPKNAQALLLQGQIAAQSGNSSAAIASLSKSPNLDANPEALRSLLQAYIKTGDFGKADPVATKLITAHNDLESVRSYAGALLEAGKAEDALGIYERYSEKFLANESKGLHEILVSAVSKSKDSALALQAILNLYQKTGANEHEIREVQELLAHALVQVGELQRAADLYHELCQAEPENPLHQQSYNQIIARLGQDSATRELSAEEAEQAFMVDELEAPPLVIQDYTKEVAEAITSALTDAELFISYNVPEKAIVPLERVLPQAPNDVRLNQRMVSIYARLGRLADAANCCAVLAEVHQASGFAEQAAQFRESAEKYKQQAGGVAASGPVVDRPPAEAARKASEVVPDQGIPFQASSVTRAEAEASRPAASEQPVIAEFDLTTVPIEPIEPAAPAPTSAPVHELPVPDITAPPAAAQAAVPEADETGQWEEMLTVEAPAAHAAEPAGAARAEVHEVEAQETPDEIAEEARFYISQGMNAEAQSAIARLAARVPDHPALEALRAAAMPKTVAPKTPVPPPHKPEAAPKPAAKKEVELPKGKPVPAAHTEDVLGDLVLDELSGDAIPEVAAGEPASFTAPPTKVPAARPMYSATAAPPSIAPRAVAQPAAADDPLAGMLSDLEDALGEIAPASTPALKPQPASAAARVTSPAPSKPTPAPQPVSVAGTVQISEAHSMLSDLMDEFKEGIEEPAVEKEDPDTHYNLGVAFREMGLLDEAIGELQKVCRLVDNGVPFSQPIQAYTWLAQCLVDKGAPQAAVRWYERALQVRGISEDSRLAVYYDMGNALEVAGNKKDALDKFMEVYGSNIDYRDVAERIRSLRA